MYKEIFLFTLLIYCLQEFFWAHKVAALKFQHVFYLDFITTKKQIVR